MSNFQNLEDKLRRARAEESANTPRYRESRRHLFEPEHLSESNGLRDDDTSRDEIQPLKTFCAAEFEGRPVPPRQWLVEGVIPHRNVTLLSGDGGLGKTILALMLGTSLSTSTDWLGFKTKQGPCLYYGAEDELDELHRRVDQIRHGLGLSWGDLADLHLKSLAGEDALLSRLDHGIIKPTKLCAKLETRIRELGAIASIIDTSADVFGGDEISRTQVRQFVGLLMGIALRNNCAVILLAHPSLSGMASGTGTSGSTAWNNSARSRLYLEAAEGDARLLHFKKSNYGPKGKPLRLRWQNGVFVPEDGEKASASAQASAEIIFLNLLDAYTTEGRNVGSSTASTYAPKVFDADRRSKGIGRNALRDAMNALFEKGEITNEEFGPPSHRRKRIIRKGKP
jgi:RecA-family ATPase